MNEKTPNQIFASYYRNKAKQQREQAERSEREGSLESARIYRMIADRLEIDADLLEEVQQ